MSTSTLPPGTSGALYAAALAASGGAAPYTWSITAGALPAGLSLAAASGVISGTPTATGSFGFTAQVTDSGAHAATVDLSISINAALPAIAILTSKLADGTTHVPYTATMSAGGGVPPYNWAVASGTLPPGLTLDNEGTIRGTPTTTGSFGFNAQVTDARGQNAHAPLSVTVNAPPPLNILTSKLATGTSGVAYGATLSASGGLKPYTWQLAAGVLPTGLALNAGTGEISGTPVATGTFAFTAQVSDAASQTTSAALSIAVNAPPALSVLTANLPSGTVGSTYSATLSAGGGVNPYTWSIAGGALPAGTSLNASSGAIRGTPSASGTFNFTAQVTDSAAQTKSAALGITIAPPPVLNLLTTSLPSGAVANTYAATLTAGGGVTPYTWSIVAGALPTGTSLNASSGAIRGTPTASGTFNFTAQVTDSAAQTKSAALSITIAPAPPLNLLTTSLPAGTVGTAYSATFSAGGGVTPYTWAIAGGALPGGLSLNTATGVISGKPTASGTFNFSARVTDAAAQTQSAALSITIAPPPPLALLTTSLPAGTVSTAYTATLAASGGITPYTWSISSGALPAGLTLNASSGTISGTPTTSGSFNFTAQVMDSAAQTQSAGLSITIAPPPPLSLLTTSLPNGTVGTAYTATLSASGGVTPYTWSISSGALPGGLSLKASSGTISGTPTASGTFNFTAQVADSAAQTKTAALSITIAVPPLTITTSSLAAGTVGTAYSATLAATGGVTPYTWAITAGSLPAGLTLSSSTGAISGTPTASGTSNFTVQVTDAATHTQSAALTIVVNTPPTNNITHVVVVMEENKSYGEVIGNTADMPYFNSLVKTYAQAANYYSNVLSSQGDYFMITVGDILTSNSSFNGVYNGDNIVRHLNAAGRVWKVYAESIPNVGYTGGDLFPYMKIHNPFAYISDVLKDPTQTDNMVPLSQLASDLAGGSLPDYSFVIPNEVNDGHDCGSASCSLSTQMANTDAWLRNNIGPLLADPDFKQHGLLIITWDESDGDGTNGGGRVATLIAGAKVKPGYVSNTFYQHQSALKLSMEALGLTSFPNSAASAPDMTEFFTGPIP